MLELMYKNVVRVTPIRMSKIGKYNKTKGIQTKSSLVYRVQIVRDIFEV